MEAIAKAKYQKGSPQKARLVIDLVRGKNVSQALSILKYTNKRAAGPISKCLNSAIANATYKAEQENIAIDPDDLWIKKCFVDIGPTKNRRRLRPAPQGRAYFERRHFCHITIEVTSEPREEEDEPTYEKRGKKVMAKKAGGAKKAKPESKKADKKKKSDEVIDEVKEEKPETEKVETEAVEVKEETPKAETETVEKAEVKDEEKVETETKAEEKSEESTEEVKEDSDAKESVDDTEVEGTSDEKAEDAKEEG